jgi:hypothetical protein
MPMLALTLVSASHAHLDDLHATAVQAAFNIGRCTLGSVMHVPLRGGRHIDDSGLVAG